MKAPAIERKVPFLFGENHSRFSDKDSISFLEDLAIDKIIAEEHLQPQNVQTTKKASDENKSGADISLQLSWDYPQYMSDNELKRAKPSFAIDDEDSAISSDSSFNKELMELEE